MTLNPIILNAILSMDAYNRGYDAGITVPGMLIGNVVVGLNSTAVFGQGVDSEIGFYAQTYEYNGVKIISFRGTDSLDGDNNNPLNAADDVYHGWSFGAGNINSEQAHMAIEFYQAVAGTGNALTANISLVGHSLRGGLAGYVANDNRPERFPGRKVA